MKTFTGKYIDKNFVYSGDEEALKSQLVSILNTPLGSRFYYPSYGSKLNEYRFSVLNYFTINMIGQEIKNAVNLIDGVTLSGISYYIIDNTLHFVVELNKTSEIIRVPVSIVGGIAS